MANFRLRSLLSYPAGYWVALLALIVAVVCAVVFEWLDDEQVHALKLSLVELAMYTTVIGVAGGLIKRAIDEKDALASFRLQVISALSEIYAKIHVLRRTLARWPDDAEIVRQRVLELMHIEQALGRIGRQIKTKRDVGQREVLAELATLRAYLEELIDEAMKSSEDGQIVIGPKLEQFLAGCDGDEQAVSEAYRRRFEAPYLRAMCAADPSWEPTREQCRIRDLGRMPEPAAPRRPGRGARPSKASRVFMAALDSSSSL
jgi:small basic protein